MLFEAEVKITLKKTIADPQGLTVKHALESLGFAGLGSVRMGKLITIELEAKEKEAAEIKIKEICQKLLANPIIEDFVFEVK